MWAAIKAQALSFTGVCTTFVHIAAVVLAFVLYVGGYQIWTGQPAPIMVAVKK